MQNAFDAIPCVTLGYMLSARLVNQKTSQEKCGGRLRRRKPVMKGGVYREAQCWSSHSFTSDSQDKQHSHRKVITKYPLSKLHYPNLSP